MVAIIKIIILLTGSSNQFCISWIVWPTKASFSFTSHLLKNSQNSGFVLFELVVRSSEQDIYLHWTMIGRWKMRKVKAYSTFKASSLKRIIWTEYRDSLLSMISLNTNPWYSTVLHLFFCEKQPFKKFILRI